VNTIPAFATPEQEALGINFNQNKISAMVELVDKTVQRKLSMQSAKVA